MASSASENVKLTPDLFQTFRRYKKATGAVVSWLAAGQDGSTWSLDNLMQAAQTAKARNVKIPLEISHAFELAIAARTEISGYFKQKVGIKDASTLSHEHFTKKLRSIYKLLRGSRLATATNGSSSTPEPQQKSIFANAFEQLTLVAPETEPSSQGNPPPTKEPPPSGYSTPTEDASHHATSKVFVEDTAGPTFSLKDDDLARDFELLYAISSLDLTCTKIKECWVKAAEGSMSVLFAAWLTTAAFMHARRYFNGGPMSIALHALDHLGLCRKYANLLKVVVVDGSENEQTGSLIIGTFPFFFHGLQTPWQAILDSQGRTYTEKELKEGMLEKPAEHVTSEAGIDDRRKAERSLMDLLLRSIRRLLYQNGEKPSDLVLAMNPLLLPLQSFYKTKGSSIQTDLVFGLHLLVESYKSFILPKRLVSTPNGRIRMLQFAQDVKSSLSRARLKRPIRASIACDCSDCRENTLIVALIKLERELEGLATERRFDLYYQAPWVAGHQMNEILSRATGLGLQACNRGHYLGTVLHMYNMLRQYDAINEETIVLEKLCAAVAEGVFSGSRPDCKFYAKFAVFSGGRLSFDRSKRHKPNSDDEICACCGDKIEPRNGTDRNWRITMPKNYSKQLNSHHISAFDGLYSCQFQHGCSCWPHVWHGLEKGKTVTEKQSSRACDELSVHPCASILDHLEGVVGAEFQGDFSVAKVNWLEIYITCTEILANLSRATRFDPERPAPEFPYDNEHWPSTGQTMALGLLSLAENFSDETNDGLGLVATHWSKIELVRDAIRMALEDKKTADFLWAV